VAVGGLSGVIYGPIPACFALANSNETAKKKESEKKVKKEVDVQPQISQTSFQMMQNNFFETKCKKRLTHLLQFEKVVPHTETKR